MKHVSLHAKGGKLPQLKHYKFVCKYTLCKSEIKSETGSTSSLTCGMRFTDEDKLIVHESVKHTQEQIKLYCEICGLAFGSIPSKKAHVAWHKDEI